MTWPPLETFLPAPRDDEPRSLREDLMDEVRDHLQSAYQGELLRTSDPVEAEKNVLARFGDPARVVRQLWLQAMREKIMSQRILVVTCLVMAVASIVGMGLMWNLNAQNQMATLELVKQNHESTAKLVERLDENQKANLQVLQAFIAEQKSSTTKKSLTTNADPEWCPVKLRFSMGKKGGPPAKGFSVSFQRYDSVHPSHPILLTVPDSGLLDLGLLKIGTYSVVVKSSTDTKAIYSTSEELQILPRQPQIPIYGEVVCPEGLPADVRMKPSVTWPEQLRDKKLWILCTFSSVWDADGQKWNLETWPVKATPWDPPRQPNPGDIGNMPVGTIDFNSQGIGYCNLDDNLKQHVRQTTFGRHVWQCLINDQGEVWDLSLMNHRSLISRPIAQHLDTFDLDFPEFRNVRTRGGQTIGLILQQYSDLSPGGGEVIWPANELKLEEVEVYSAPHQQYGSIGVMTDDRTGKRYNTWNMIVAQDLLGSFRVQNLADSEGLPGDDLLCKFRGTPGKENSLEIAIPEAWQAEILKNYSEREKFKKTLEAARKRRSTSPDVHFRGDEDADKTEQSKTLRPAETNKEEA